MRVSSTQMNTSGLREIINRQSELNTLQLKMSTQRSFLTPADDPVAATTVLNLETEIALNTQYMRNADLAENAITLEESVLGSVTNLGFRLQQIFVSLGNGVYAENELDALKEELSQIYQEMTGLANTRSANGEYIFSGFLTRVKPFEQDPSGNVLYQGDHGQRSLKISSGVSVPISDSGFDIFVNIPQGNGSILTGASTTNTGTGIVKPQVPGAIVDDYQIVFTSPTTYDIVNTTTATTVAAGAYTPGATISYSAPPENFSVNLEGAPVTGDSFSITPSRKQSIFTTLEQVLAEIDNFTDTPANRAIFSSNMIPIDRQLNSFMTNVDIIRAKIGSRLNTITEEKQTNISLKVTQETTLSKLKDLDFVSAASELSRLTTVLEAAQASFVRVQNLNIFNYLR